MRGSGRTTRMLADAIRQHDETGRAIRIIIRDANHERYMKRIAEDRFGRRLGPHTFISSQNPRDLDRQLRGIYREDVFIDHAVWERNDERVLQRLDGELGLLRSFRDTRALPYFKERHHMSWIIPEPPD